LKHIYGNKADFSFKFQILQVISFLQLSVQPEDTPRSFMATCVNITQDVNT